MKMNEMMGWIVSITVLHPPSQSEGGASERGDASGGCERGMPGRKGRDAASSQSNALPFGMPKGIRNPLPRCPRGN